MKLISDHSKAIPGGSTSRQIRSISSMPWPDDTLDLLLNFRQAEVAAVLDDQFEAAGRAETRHRWGCKKRCPALGNLLIEFFLNAQGDAGAGHVQPELPGQLAAAVETVKADEELTEVRGVG